MSSPRRLGVLGWPVRHSRSPAMQGAALAALGLAPAWTYDLLACPPEALAELLEALPGAGFVGANVTIPHKEAALAAADTASEAARAIGAANTLTFGADGLHAENTDAPGLLAALGDVTPRGRRALVLGAGGSARAAAWALRSAGADVVVRNRSHARAAALAADLGVRAEPASAPVHAELLVNCTSLGLDGRTSPLVQDLGVAADDLPRCSLVVDLVYRPDGPTPLLRAATRAGVATVDGLEVLVRQGALSLAAWTGLEPPIDVMRAAAHGRP